MCFLGFEWAGTLLWFESCFSHFFIIPDNFSCLGQEVLHKMNELWLN